jgi:hypothetical protein
MLWGLEPGYPPQGAAATAPTATAPTAPTPPAPPTAPTPLASSTSVRSSFQLLSARRCVRGLRAYLFFGLGWGKGVSATYMHTHGRRAFKEQPASIGEKKRNPDGPAEAQLGQDAQFHTGAHTHTGGLWRWREIALAWQHARPPGLLRWAPPPWAGPSAKRKRARRQVNARPQTKTPEANGLAPLCPAAVFAAEPRLAVVLGQVAPAGVPLAVSPAGAGLRRITLYQLSRLWANALAV